jgi:hypothetical protein
MERKGSIPDLQVRHDCLFESIYLTTTFSFRVDLKTIMAEAESGRSQRPPSSSRTRVVGFQPAATPSLTVSSTPRDTRKPWGVPETAPPSSPLSRGSSSSFPPPSTPNSSGPLPPKVTAPRRPISRPGGVPYPTHLGPVITPARILSGDLSAKRRGPRYDTSLVLLQSNSSQT